MSIINFEFYPTGVLYNSRESARNAKNLRLCIERNKLGITKQRNPHLLTNYKPEDGWHESNEPEEHLDEVKNWIQKKCTKKDARIALFSYKDKTLALRMADTGNKEIEYVYPPRGKDTVLNRENVWPEEDSSEEISRKILSITNSVDIFIFRHYLEHCTNHEIIIDAIASKLTKQGIIYIEIPDCNKFFTKNIPLFAWEQHRYYFTKQTFEDWAITQGYDIEIRQIGESIEPSICCILSKKKDKSISKRGAILNSRWEFNFDNYINSWKRMIENKSNKFILGVGHNTDRFLQLVDERDGFDGLIDNDKGKEGKYLATYKYPIESKLPIKQNAKFELILGVHDRAYEALKIKLSKTYKYAKISSIFEEYGKH